MASLYAACLLWNPLVPIMSDSLPQKTPISSVLLLSFLVPNDVGKRTTGKRSLYRRQWTYPGSRSQDSDNKNDGSGAQNGNGDELPHTGADLPLIGLAMVCLSGLAVVLHRRRYRRTS